MNLLPKLVFYFLTFFIIENVKADYYTSIATLHDLLEAELRIMSYLEEYMQKMENTSRQVDEKLNELERASKEGDESNEFYENPINAYKIISRLAIDWQNVRKAVFDKKPGKTYLSNIMQLVNTEGFALPTREDVVGASKGLARLQRTYHLETNDVADGYLMDIKYAEEITASECYALGQSLFEAANYEYAAEWLLQARIRLVGELKAANGTRQLGQVTDVQILLKLAPTMYYLGKSKLAILFNDELLEQDPTNEYGLQNMEIYSRKALEERHPTPFDQPNKAHRPTKIEKLFDEVCSGDLQQTPREKRKLRCRYVHNNVPFRYLAPFKKEELNHDPSVAYYHEFVSENEIDRIIEESEDSVQRSTVGNLEKPVKSDVRTSQNTWLYFKNHTFLNDIAQRLKDVTGLSLESAEPLQVANYGIGGHYGPHYDFYVGQSNDFHGRGNRLATALIYINDVEIGGATAFPYLKLAADPIKRSVIVWDNLHKSLELDYRTKHGGCPVLVGSKWICNEWFHVVDQEFTRPCDLENDGYKSLPFKESKQR